MVHVPAATPVTTPEELTVAIAVELLVHAPPVVASLSAVVNNAQVEAFPVIVPAVQIGVI